MEEQLEVVGLGEFDIQYLSMAKKSLPVWINFIHMPDTLINIL
jgi:hypothetical protein